MKETTQPPKDPKKKLWIGYAIILAIVILSNVFLFPALMQASVKSVNYSTFLQMLESKELATVQIEDQQIYFVTRTTIPTKPTPLRRTTTSSPGWRMRGWSSARFISRPRSGIRC